MSQLVIEIPDEMETQITLSRHELQSVAKEALMVRLYAAEQISSGRAAALLGISRREFLDLLDQYGVSVFDETMDLASEVAHVG